MATPDFDQNPNPNPNFTTSIEAASPQALGADSKRTLFGRKKKSANNLGSSQPSGALTSEFNDSVESFGSGGSAKKKGVKDIFKRKGREDSLGSNDGGFDPRSRGREDETWEGQDSDGEPTPKLRPQSAGYLTSKEPQVVKKKSANGLFNRRSTSPMAPGAPRNRTSTLPSLVVNEDETHSNARPFTAGPGTSQPSEPNGQRTEPSATASRKTSSSLSKVNVNTSLAPAETAPQITATPPTPIENATAFPAKNQFPSIAGESQQRARASSISKAPSKLSQSMTSPETPPAAERSPEPDKEAKQSGGFFQSMFSAAQNAATTLTNNMPLNLQGQPERPRSSNSSADDKTGASQIQERAEPGLDSSKPEREPAVKTLGSGELSLAALGISNEPSTRNRSSTATSSTSDAQNRGQRMTNESSSDVSQFGLDRSQTLPLSAMAAHGGFEDHSAHSERKAGTPMVEEALLSSRRGGELTPDRNSMVDENEAPDGSKKAGSVRSGQGSEKKRRHRGSSTASAAPNATHSVPRATGFAVATKKRNRDFHNLFRSVPEDDYLIEDYGCALQKEILLQGRFYVSEGHICFYSNILGWVTQLVISFDEVVSVEKKSTALLFPNGIVIQTLHARHTFASFITRDATYDLIIGLWNVGHPGLVQTPGEAHLDGAHDHGRSSGEEEDDEYEDEDDEDLGDAFTDADDGGDDEPKDGPAGSKYPSRKGSELVLGGGEKDGDGGKVDFPGPSTHAPTTCRDEHYDKPLCNEVFPVPLGRIYGLLFGTQSQAFITSLLLDEEKVFDLQIPNDGQWTDQGGKKTRQYTYTKPLNGPIGPKQTKCIITESIDFCELEDHVTVTVSTQTPDVPSGGVFLVKTKYCLTWAEDNSTRMVLGCTVEWSGKSWIKGPIEKGALDGQTAFTKNLIACLKREIAPKKAAGRGAGGKGKGKRRKDSSPPAAISTSTVTTSAPTAANPVQSASWGVFEPLKPVLGPVADTVSSIMPGSLTNILLLIIVFWLFFFRPGNVPEQGGVKPSGPAEWEARWRNEEVSLWDWLEDRTGMIDHTAGSSRARSRAFQQTLGAKTAAKGLKDHQLKEAVQVMEERLEVLKRMVEERNVPVEESGSSQKKTA